MTDRVTATLGAVVLAGGTGERLGGVSKADVTLAGRRLLDRAIDACRDAGAREVVVVGAVEVSDPAVHVVVEDPPRSGPAAGLIAGLAALHDSDHLVDHVLVLACDLADPTPGARALAQALPLPHGMDGLCVAEVEGTPQWLFGVYQRPALDAAAAAFGTATHRSVRALMAPLHLSTLPATDGIAGDDIDTWEAHRAWSQRLG